MRKAKVIFFLLVACLILPFFLGCSDGNGDNNQRLLIEANPPPTPLTFENVLVGLKSGGTEKFDFVITDETAWLTLWNKVHEPSALIPALPLIDFTQETVLASFQGEQLTEGYKIEIQSLDGTDPTIATVVNTTPADNCPTNQEPSQPFHIIKLNRPTVEAQFFHQDVVTDCS